VRLAGAGKTNVAVLCILHELGLHLKNNGGVERAKNDKGEEVERVGIDTSAFKIVYVAPMKALVAEMVGNFSTRLGEAYGLKVRELTGALMAAVCGHALWECCVCIQRSSVVVSYMFGTQGSSGALRLWGVRYGLAMASSLAEWHVYSWFRCYETMP
jgi:hypothetical protein